MLTNGAPDPGLFDALDRLIVDEGLDPAFRALALALPSEDDIAQAAHDAGLVPDPTKIHATRKALQTAMAEALRDTLAGLYDAMDPGPDYSPDARQAAQRSLRNAALALLTRIEGKDRAAVQYDAASNMTDEIAAFTALLEAGDTEIATRFHDRWTDDRLVMDKWFMAQVAHAEPADAVETAQRLTEHPLFDWTNPNRVRSVIGGLTAGNPAGFHDPTGAGYRTLADWLIRIDAKNPQTAARMSTAFETWARYDADRQDMIRGELDRIAATEGLSRDLSEMVDRIRRV
jgi:aminopeptidase N